MLEKKYSIGIDIGGSHISCVAIDRSTQQLVKETFKRSKLSHTEEASTIFKVWGETINDCLLSVGIDNVKGLGFAVPGPFNYKEGISLMEHKFPNLYKLHIPSELQKQLINKELEMRFLNDASSFAVGVCWGDKAKDYERVVAVTLGTGFGSAYMINGVPVVKSEEVAPEGCFWHLPFKNGIADEYFSTRWFTNSYKEKTGKDIKGVKELLEQSEAQLLFDDFGKNLGEFLCPWLKKFQTEALILGGNISLAYPYFEKTLKNAFEKAGLNTQIMVSELMEDAAMVGAARLFEDDFWEKIAKDLPNM